CGSNDEKRVVAARKCRPSAKLQKAASELAAWNKGRTVKAAPPEARVSSSSLVLAQVVGVIEAIGLPIEVIDRDFGEGGFGQNLLGDVLDRAVHDFVNEADVGVLARGDPRDHFAPGHLGIDHGLPATAAVVDHDDEILHQPHCFRKSEESQAGLASDSRNCANLPRTMRTYRDLALRARDAALARNRAICPRGKVTQISPIQSSFTPLIGFALKLERLTRPVPLPRSIVFR